MSYRYWLLLWSFLLLKEVEAGLGPCYILGIFISIYRALSVYLAPCSALTGLKVKAWFSAHGPTLRGDNEHMWSNEAVGLDRVLLILMMCRPA